MKNDSTLTLSLHNPVAHVVVNSASTENGSNNKPTHTHSALGNNNDFRIIVQPKDKEMASLSLTFVASSLQEKSAWCSDISQVITGCVISQILNFLTKTVLFLFVMISNGVFCGLAQGHIFLKM